MNPIELFRHLGAVGDAFRSECSQEDACDWTAGRPSLPPVLLLALALWGSCAAGIELLYGASAQECLCLCIAGFVAAAMGVVLLVARQGLAACLLIGIALGCLLAGTQAGVLLRQAENLLHQPAFYEVQLVRDARSGDYGASALARTQQGALVRLRFAGDAPYLVGDRLRVHAAFDAPSQKQARDSWRQGVVGVARVGECEVLDSEGVVSILRDARRSALASIGNAGKSYGSLVGAIESITAHLGHEDAPLGEESRLQGDEALKRPVLFLRAVLLGYTDGLYASSLYQTVRVDGLAHLLAVSGAHLVVVCSIVMVLMKRLAISRWLAVVLQVAFICCYLVLTGAPMSAIRAAAMTSLALMSFFARRRPYALGALGACIVVMIAHDPLAAFSLSFALSVAATLGIVLFCGFFEAWIARPLLLESSPVVDALALTCAASLSTIPVSASLFGQVSLVAPLANVLAAPVFSLVCIAGFAALALAALLPAVGTAVLVAVLLLVDAFCWVLQALSNLPAAAVPVYLPFACALAITVGIPLLVWMRWPQPQVCGYAMVGTVAVIAVAASCAYPWLQGDQIVMLDVGQGDAFLVRSDGHAMLVDTGTNDVMLLQGLGACGVRHLDAVLVTHPDDDHCGSLTALKGIVGVDRVLVAADLLEDADEHCARLRACAHWVAGPQGLVGLQVSDVIVCGNFAFTVIGPDGFKDGGGNADSLVLVMESDENRDGCVDHTALFCGDAESEQLATYAAAGRVPPVEIYKVGHHGSRAAVTTELASLMSPSVSLVSVGEYNRYGHPVQETLAILEDAGSTIFRTDRQGMVTCSLKADCLEVRTQR